MLFNEQGILDIDGLVAQQSTFKKIMADGIVSEEELQAQSERVLEMLHETERRFSEDDQQFINLLFAETNVLSAIYHYYQLQNLR